MTGIGLMLKYLICVTCRAGALEFNQSDSGILCRSCGAVYNAVNGVPCFVSAELENFSEVPPDEREQFLAMKRAAYGNGFFVSRMYRHYHRYAAQKRSDSGDIRLTVDVGFGIGEHYPFITEKEKVDGSFIGVDLDRFKLEYFAAVHPEIPVLQASAFRLPFADSSADVVQLLATLEHFPPDEITGLLDESLRILKPGGTLIVCYPAEGGLMLRLCQRIMHAYLKGRTGFDLDKGAVHRHFAAAGEIMAILGGREELERLDSSFYPFRVKLFGLSLFVNEIYRKR